MTVVSDVRSCCAGIKHAEAVFSKLALQSLDSESKAVFHECMMSLTEVADQLNKRILELENEEPEYRNT
ncbi:hypothetical protein JOC78_002833 [Bacillus ectoiniformans]|uniref:DUF1657 domain-containing protein n=1 Tax=Bacillus ectoiniformans TaxID=1494429 RepID=UPI00195D1045|nr:DUF1657 domain-containing protein [Bacillus ectoiniformans]MBM7649849.1 hypothetical protein [Bacillus ectoiniformans]